MKKKMTKGVAEMGAVEAGADAEAYAVAVDTGVLEVDSDSEEETADKKRNYPLPLFVAAVVVLLVAFGGGVYFVTSYKPPVVETPAPQTETAGSGQTGVTAGKTKPPATGVPKDTGGGKEENTEPEGEVGGSGDGDNSGDGAGVEPGSGETGDGTSGGSGGGSTSGTGGGSNNNKTWHEGWDEWVVDVPGHNEQRLVSAAWDEELGHYGNICNDCGAEITGQAGQHLLDTGHSGYTNYYWFVDGTIHHDAVYETVWVAETGHWVHHDGYWQ